MPFRRRPNPSLPGLLVSRCMARLVEVTKVNMTERKGWIMGAEDDAWIKIRISCTQIKIEDRIESERSTST